MAARRKKASTSMAHKRKRPSSEAVAHKNLERYRQKRDFSKTPEPQGIPAAKTGHRYLIQKHAATRLHYDFRLELDGVLKSWAVTRGPSLDPHDKRLAVEVEDHPVSYGSFEGIIPKGQYGGGTVMLWDEGSWEPVGDPHKGLKDGKLVFKLHGKRLTGEWTLVRMRDREKDKGRHNWLLIKHHDKVAKAGGGEAFLEKHKTSVVSGRTMEKIAAAQDNVWQSKSVKKKAVIASIAKQSRTGLPRRSAPRNDKLPPFNPPQLATLTDKLPEGKDWVHEIKFDGYRALFYIQNGNVTMYTRTGQDWTHKFRTLANKLAALPVKNAILDGEIVALEKGISSFKGLKNALSDGHDEMLQYYVFDLLYLNGKDLTGLSLLERKAALQPLIGKGIGGRVFYSEHFTKSEKDILDRICNLQMEGLISKRADAPYSHRRGTAWLKTKCHKRQEFVIGGYTKSSTGASIVGSLLLGYYEGKDFVYAGRVGTGFDTKTARTLFKTLQPLKRPDMAYTKYSDAGRRGPGWKRGVVWVEPKLVCEVEFTEWTEDGALRHPSFQGLREDKPATSISRDVPMAVKKTIKPEKAKTTLSTKKADVGGIGISHPERIIYPGTDITKLQLAGYYHTMAEYILPHVKNRPLSMVRCPEGIGSECFFQRHIAHDQPHIHNTGIRVKGRNEEYVMIKDVKGLITLIQWGAIELHPWGCLADKPDLPDRMIFDLDPDPDVPFSYVMEGVKEIRDRMREFGLESFVKTTGGKGLHAVVPLTRRYGWDTIKSFARAVADSMQSDNPKRYIAKSSKAARKGKIFVDYLRNDLTSTSVAAFSARARAGATVAMPIAWEALKSSLQPKNFTIETVPSLLKKRKTDPWEEFFKVKQKIPAQHLRALKIDI